ncbi:uncharacterized protein LOC105701414 [Orussus abietinus]|uniref:uncharacterized protein LOC105701414 n=1 Tax=Orussus abietinus TaxID=222816 RepID=UPI000C715D60|nr:uncharacterized protein LOC105701414 [Orussus abietinus]
MAVNFLSSAPKLKVREDCSNWAFTVRHMLVLDELQGCLDGTETDTGKDGKALAKLILKIDPSLSIHVKEAKKAEDLWTQLEHLFSDSGFCRRIGLLRALTSIKLVNWLPEKYASMIMAVEYSGMHLTVDSIKTKLLDMEPANEAGNGNAFGAGRNNKHNNRNSYSRVGNTGANSSNAQMSGTCSYTNPNLQNVRCYKCKQTGHYKNKCPNNKTDKKGAFNAAFLSGEFNNQDWCVSGLATNLLSLNLLIHKGNQVVFDNGGCKIYNSENILVAVADLINSVYIINCESTVSYSVSGHQQQLLMGKHGTGGLAISIIRIFIGCIPQAPSQGETINSAKYCNLLDQLRAVMAEKRLELSNRRGVVFHHDNVCNNSTDETISREVPVSSHLGSTVAARTAVPSEPNYLDPTPIRNNSRGGVRLSNNQHNGVGRLGSVGSSNGPMSPQGTLSSPSPPPMLPPPPPVPQPLPSSLYVNEEVLAVISMDTEHNNNKSHRRTMQRSCTVNSTTSGSGFGLLDCAISQSHQEFVHHQAKPPPLSMASYINIDISSEASPLSPSHSISDSTLPKDENNETDCADHAYMNVSPGQEQIESTCVTRTRPPPLPPIQSDWDDGSRHCYANLESSEIEGLKKRFSGISIAEKSPLPPSTPPAGSLKEVNYAVLDLDKGNSLSIATPEGTSNTIPSPPDSPNKPVKGYATIDFNKTAALSHSVNPNLVNDNEGSRKTRHNSTINDLTASRHSSSISE